MATCATLWLETKLQEESGWGQDRDGVAGGDPGSSVALEEMSKSEMKESGYHRRRGQTEVQAKGSRTWTVRLTVGQKGECGCLGAGAGMGSQPLMQREAGSSTNGFQNTVSVLYTAELSP